MSSAVDIQIVSHPNLEKIESFFKDVSYRETIEFSANFNTRLCLERRLRLPFLDPQTGVAQNHSQLFMDKRNRMPGFRQGQIYTYPSARWRKSRRQYLTKMYRFPDRPFQALRKEQEALTTGVGNPSILSGMASPTVVTAGSFLNDSDFHGALLEDTSSLGAAGGDTSDSKDSQQQQQNAQHQQLKEDLPKEWFFDDIDINDADSFEDPKSPADDEYDYDPRYGTKKRRKRRTGKRAPTTALILPGEGSSRRRSGAGRGRATSSSLHSALDSSISMDSIDGCGGGGAGGGGVAGVGGDISTTPTSRRTRGTGARGRRRAKSTATGGNSPGNPPSPGLINEPPSFESAAAAVGVSTVGGEEHGDLRNYRKYL